jgi:hypothetical protein
MNKQLKKIVLTKEELNLLLHQNQVRISRKMDNPPVMLHDAWYWSHPDYDNGDGINYIHTQNITYLVSEYICEFCPYGKINDRLKAQMGWSEHTHFMPHKVVEAKITDLYIELTEHSGDVSKDLWNWVICLGKDRR